MYSILYDCKTICTINIFYISDGDGKIQETLQKYINLFQTLQLKSDLVIVWFLRLQTETD